MKKIILIIFTLIPSLIIAQQNYGCIKCELLMTYNYNSYTLDFDKDEDKWTNNFMSLKPNRFWLYQNGGNMELTLRFKNKDKNNWEYFHAYDKYGSMVGILEVAEDAFMVTFKRMKNDKFDRKFVFTSCSFVTRDFAKFLEERENIKCR